MLDGQATGFLWGIVIVCAIGLLIIIPVLISKTKTAVNNTQKMEGVGPSIKNLSKKAKAKLDELGFIEPNDYSTAGYEFFEYKTKYNYEDNLHLVIDHKSKQIAYYQYVPFHVEAGKTYTDFVFFEVHSFKDVTKAEIINNLGVVNTVSLGTGVGTSIGGIGVGVGVANSTSTQEVNSLGLSIYFKDGKSAGVNFLHNCSTTMGSSVYNNALMQAKELLNICEIIIKENEKKEEAPSISQSSSLDELKKLKELLDEGIITQEEFDLKKKELLGL